MCLENISHKLVAQKDITVWKRIIRDTHAIIDPKHHGKNFEVRIRGQMVEGKISIERDRYFFCHNLYQFDGSSCSEKFGYFYSWVNDHEVDLSTLKIDGVKVNIETIHTYKTPYQKFVIEFGKKYESIIRVKDDEIYEGIHSFKRMISAKDDGWGYVVKCIIPKGSVYYVGSFSDEESYASDTIIYGTKAIKIKQSWKPSAPVSRII